ncbi:MAG: hypothetical protein K6B52_01190 [Clostridiales bacterium]|nr:hypothetical protein [Clostridiales bacterium]
MKKLLSLIFTTAFLFSLCACQKETEKPAVTISGVDIEQGVYNYFYYYEAKHASLSGEKTNESDYALSRCKRFVAINTIFHNKGMVLTNADKIQVSEKVNNFMLRFKDYFDKIGVSRQNLTSIFTCEKREEALFQSEYDTGTDNIQAEEAIKNYFYDNYVLFYNACGYYETDENGNIVATSKTNLNAVFSSLVADYTLTPENSSNLFSAGALEKGFPVSDGILLKRGESSYPEGFFEKVFAQTANTVRVYTYDECVFAVLKSDLTENGDTLYESYRSACIKDIYSVEWEDRITDIIKDL